jgi:hypothetical protein
MNIFLDERGYFMGFEPKDTAVNYPPLNVLTDCLKWGLLG